MGTGTLTPLVQNYDHVTKTGVDVFSNFETSQDLIKAIQGGLQGGGDLDEEVVGLITGYRWLC